MFIKDYDKCSEYIFKIFGFKFFGEFFIVGFFCYEDKYIVSLSRRKEKKYELVLIEKFFVVKFNFVNR